MTDLHWRLIILVVGATACMIRASYDLAPMSGESRREWIIGMSWHLFAATVVIQLFGFDPMPMHLAPVTDAIVRCCGVAFGVIAGIAITWPRGVRSSWNGPMTSPTELCTSGPYKYVRHPFYAGMLIGYLGIEMTLASWMLLLIAPLALISLIIVIDKEEKRLKETFGDNFSSYASRSWRFVPLIY